VTSGKGQQDGGGKRRGNRDSFHVSDSSSLEGEYEFDLVFDQIIYATRAEIITTLLRGQLVDHSNL